MFLGSKYRTSGGVWRSKDLDVLTGSAKYDEQGMVRYKVGLELVVLSKVFVDPTVNMELYMGKWGDISPYLFVAP